LIIRATNKEDEMRNRATVAMVLGGALVLVACGGGESALSLPRPAQAGAVAASALSAQDAADVLMDIAEAHYNALFPGHAPTQFSGPFAYRYYPLGDLYLGVVVGGGSDYVLGGVYVMGGTFGPAPVFVGLQSAFVHAVDLSAGGTDNGCADLQAFEGPGRHTVVVRSSTPGATSGTSIVDTQYLGFAPFQGNSAMQVESVTQSVSAARDDYTAYARHTGDGELTFYGSLDTRGPTYITPSLTSTTTATVVYAEPYIDRRYKLAIGETVAQTYTQTTTTNVSFEGPSPPIPTTTSGTRAVREVITYVGRETLTLAAGTYDTCKFEVVMPPTTLMGFLIVSTYWIVYGTGISVQTVTTYPGSSLSPQGLYATSVTLNGQKL
jgi:hypothetical protein